VCTCWIAFVGCIIIDSLLYYFICTNDVNQHEHEVFQMINGAVVVVVILQESVGVDQHLGHVIIVQKPLAFQFGD
jgi:hypothetical protein